MKIVFDSDEIKEMLVQAIALKIGRNCAEVQRTSTISMVNVSNPLTKVDINYQQLEVEFHE